MRSSMTDKEYKRIADKVSRHHDFYANAIAGEEYEGRKIIHIMWLRVMGLMETWDISRYDRN